MRNLRGGIALIYGVLLAGNVAAWAAAWFAFGGEPALLAAANLAYLFGLRHAFDADHIAAIDNATRRLMHDGRPAIAGGLFFSLGHSSLVVAVSLAIALLAGPVEAGFAVFGNWSGSIGTALSAAFLFVIAAANLAVAGEVWRLLQKARLGHAFDETALRASLERRGLLGRLLRPAFRLVSRSWHMFPLGVMFALGFETASEVGLLGISATAAASGVWRWSILLFPALFTVAMTLADTTDGILMAGAYGWAFGTPIRKLWYNFTVTLLSVFVAGFVGAIEVFGLIGRGAGLDGALWRWIAALGRDPAALGLAILGLFLASWSLASLLYRLKRSGARNRA